MRGSAQRKNKTVKWIQKIHSVRLYLSRGAPKLTLSLLAVNKWYRDGVRWLGQLPLSINSFITPKPCTPVYLLPMAAFVLQWQSWVVVTETVRPRSWKYLLSGPLRKSLTPGIEKHCELCNSPCPKDKTVLYPGKAQPSCTEAREKFRRSQAGPCIINWATSSVWFCWQI